MFSSDIPIIVVILTALFLAMGLYYSVRLRSFEARLQALLAKIVEMNADSARHSNFSSKLAEERLAQTELALSQLRSDLKMMSLQQRSGALREASEMVEMAINLSKAGESPDVICERTGLSKDIVESIAILHTGRSHA
jgi:hypothetical protein